MSNLTVRGAVKEIFDQMPETFFSLDLCKQVRAKLKNQTMDSSITRRLRRLKKDGILNYKVIDIPSGQYQKLA